MRERGNGAPGDPRADVQARDDRPEGEMHLAPTGPGQPRGQRYLHHLRHGRRDRARCARRRRQDLHDLAVRWRKGQRGGLVDEVIVRYMLLFMGFGIFASVIGLLVDSC